MSLPGALGHARLGADLGIGRPNPLRRRGVRREKAKHAWLLSACRIRQESGENRPKAQMTDGACERGPRSPLPRARSCLLPHWGQRDQTWYFSQNVNEPWPHSLSLRWEKNSCWLSIWWRKQADEAPGWQEGRPHGLTARSTGWSLGLCLRT